MVAYFFKDDFLNYIRIQYSYEQHTKVHRYLDSNFKVVSRNDRSRLKILSSGNGHLAVLNSLAFNDKPHIFTWQAFKNEVQREPETSKSLSELGSEL
ncbi:MAG: hypothetical protein ACI9W6_002953 [Motiliproteus sp.]